MWRARKREGSEPQGGGSRERESLTSTINFILRLEVNHCGIWFIRFCVDYRNELLALGNTAGKILLWDLTDNTRIK